MMPIKRLYEDIKDSSDCELPSTPIDEELLILQPACRLQDLEIQCIVEEVLRGNLRGVFYNAWDSEARSSFLREVIKQELRKMNLNVSNVAVLVMIGELNDTTIEKASHRVWKPEYDSFASAWYRNESLFAIGTVFINYNKSVRQM
ncbi:hypothetical protein QZH41_007859 [Actinostola sp. cb2023]|nr:hypothetical protein QZH41_007859 [Actinostola sp. cb2023]